MSIRLKLDGFNELLKEIEKAQGNVQKATEKCMKQSAELMQAELKSEMQKSNVSGSLIGRMPNYKVENDYGKITATVGYEKGEYNSKNPSDAYKVIFINYGTPNRKKHGKIPGKHSKIKLGFIQRAKKKAKPKIKKQQEQTLQEILKGLKS